jgi:hypothetical protein
MDNQDNSNRPINPIPNNEFYSPYKESPFKLPQQNKDLKYIYQTSSPFHQNIGLGFTPSKKMDMNNGFFPSLGETPLPLNMNLAFSPFANNNRGDASYQKAQYQQRRQSFSDLTPFKPLFSPNNNQRISDKK